MWLVLGNVFVCWMDSQCILEQESLIICLIFWLWEKVPRLHVYIIKRNKNCYSLSSFYFLGNIGLLRFLLWSHKTGIIERFGEVVINLSSHTASGEWGWGVAQALSPCALLSPW